MGTIDDTRKLLQDLVTPDLKALEARLAALEKTVELRFKHIDEKLEQLTAQMDLKFVTLEARTDLKFAVLEEKMDIKFAALEQKMDLKFDIVLATMAANQAAVMRSLDMERRIEKLESDRLGGKQLERPA